MDTIAQSKPVEYLRKCFKRFKESPLGARILRGTLWVFVGTVATRGLGQIASIWVARSLGKEQFGELSMIQATVGMLGTFAGFGLGVTATKHIAEFRSKDPFRAGEIFVFSELTAIITGGLLALALLFGAPWLATHSLKDPKLVLELRISALILFFNALDGAQTGALAGFEAFKEIAYVSLFICVVNLPALILGVYWDGLTGAVLAQAGVLVLTWFLNHWAIRKYLRLFRIPLVFKSTFSHIRVLWEFSLPAVLAGAMVGPINWVCNTWLIDHKNGYEQVAVLNGANQWCASILFFPGIIGQVALPFLTNIRAESSALRSRNIIFFYILVNMLLSLAVVLPLTYFARPLMAMYGTDFGEGAGVLRVLAAAAVLISANDVIGQAITSAGKMWSGFMFNAVWGSILLSASFVLLRDGYGAMGIAWAFLFAYACHTLFQGIYLFTSLART